MISNPKHGWCSFELGDFVGSPSYLTNVPIDLLDAFLDYHNKGMGMAWFDEEGSEFTLVINPYSLFIIEERGEKPILHDFSKMKVEDLEKELLSDIENDFIGWLEFTDSCDQEEFVQNRNEIRQRIAKLKNI